MSIVYEITVISLLFLITTTSHSILKKIDKINKLKLLKLDVEIGF